MIKFREIGTYKVAHNIGYLKTTVVLKNGKGVTFNLADKTIALPTAVTAKGEVAIVMNTIDKPEIKTPNEYTIEIGEYPRLFTLKSIVGRVLQMDGDQVVDIAALAIKDKLTLNTDGKWVKTTDVTGFESYLEVIDKDAYNGRGISALVVLA